MSPIIFNNVIYFLRSLTIEGTLSMEGKFTRFLTGLCVPPITTVGDGKEGSGGK